MLYRLPEIRRPARVTVSDVVVTGRELWLVHKYCCTWLSYSATCGRCALPWLPVAPLQTGFGRHGVVAQTVAFVFVMRVLGDEQLANAIHHSC